MKYQLLLDRPILICRNWLLLYWYQSNNSK